MTEGLVPDVMHDVLEGCLPYEVKELLKHIIRTKVVSHSDLNSIIQSFPWVLINGISQLQYHLLH